MQEAASPFHLPRNRRHWRRANHSIGLFHSEYIAKETGWECRHDDHEARDTAKFQCFSFSVSVRFCSRFTTETLAFQFWSTANLISVSVVRFSFGSVFGCELDTTIVSFHCSMYAMQQSTILDFRPPVTRSGLSFLPTPFLSRKAPPRCPLPYH
jgi:hypothetical protein